jgi:hypothetical protein
MLIWHHLPACRWQAGDHQLSALHCAAWQAVLVGSTAAALLLLLKRCDSKAIGHLLLLTSSNSAAFSYLPATFMLLLLLLPVLLLLVVVGLSSNDRPTPVQLLQQHHIRYLMIQHHVTQPYAVISPRGYCSTMPKRTADNKGKWCAIVACLADEACYVLGGCCPASFVQDDDAVTWGQCLEHLQAKRGKQGTWYHTIGIRHGVGMYRVQVSADNS